ncbi:MAG: carbamoyltransferase C-terminal domain-containing protein [Thermoleophilaceae bacterium]
MKVLGVNAVFHDPAAALLVDGVTVAAAEEERFSRRKHGKPAVAFSTWELPEQAMRWCLDEAGLAVEDLDAVAYSYDPALAPEPEEAAADEWEALRTLYVRRAPNFLRTALPGLDARRVRYVAHHLAHAASAHMASPHERSAVLVADGRGERASLLLAHGRGTAIEPIATQPLPHSLGLLYEDLTAHLGFHRSSDEYKVMALASYGEPRFLDELRRLVTVDGDGGFHVGDVDFERLAPALAPGGTFDSPHADLASSVQHRLEEVLLELARLLHERTGERALTMAGGVALNCVANRRLLAEGPFDDVWVQPASGDAGTALGGAMVVAAELGDDVRPLDGADLGRRFSDHQLQNLLSVAALAHERPDDLADEVAGALAAGDVVAWFQGRAELGPRALGHRSLLADPRDAANLERLNDIKGREQFRPVAPMVLLERAAEIFDGAIPSPYMLFTHDVRPEWRDRIPAVVHVDGTARVQTVDRRREPLVARMLEAFERRTGVPVVVNTSLNTAGRPMVDHPRDALECFGSAPVDVLALGPFLVRRAAVVAGAVGERVAA